VFGSFPAGGWETGKKNKKKKTKGKTRENGR
jgi:hypothetical protein